ncbi:MAG: hypothetical protein R3E79_47490 [Caldilineaceae bacterium]
MDNGMAIFFKGTLYLIDSRIDQGEVEEERQVAIAIRRGLLADGGFTKEEVKGLCLIDIVVML